MPRLNHKKARTGCQRCKQRKVKCDEIKPRCTACMRHNVSCEYVEPPPRSKIEQLALPTLTPARETYSSKPPETDDTRGLDPRLEVRLMHEWTAYTCESFSTAIEFWRLQAPLFAIEYRSVMDAMFGLAALHSSRRPAAQWIPVGSGRLVPIRNPIYKPSYAPRSLNGEGGTAEDQAKKSYDMLLNARFYFDRAIDGHRRGLAELTRENIEPVYLTSILVSFHALFSLSESDDGPRTLPRQDPLLWLRLADGTRYLCEVWRDFVGDQWMDATAVYFGKPRFDEEEALFRQEQGRPWQQLLNFGDLYETPSPEDRDAYEKCLACIALVYKSISEELEAPLVNCRRLVALPSRLPKRFIELIELRSPRAMVLLAHAFATMKLISEKVPWFRGIAETQIPMIHQAVPESWHELMTWPMKVAEGQIGVTSKEADIRDILSL